MRRKIRLALLLTALAAVGAWAAFGGKEARQKSVDVAAATKAPPSAAAVAAASPAPAPASAIPERASFDRMGADPFDVEPPPAPAPTVATPPPPARPVAPPLPYRFAGRLHIGDTVEVYLTKGEDLIPVKKGDKLDGQYRVDKIGRTEMTLVHLASGTKQKIEYDPPIKDDDASVADAPAAAPEAHAEAQRRIPHGG